MNIAQLAEKAFQEASKITSGRTAIYIPELAKVNGELFSMSICDLEGEVFSCGDSEARFTLQSISKVAVYLLALENFSEEEIDIKVGVEPTGDVFDSIIKLDEYQRPFNPMINAGAIAITDLLITKFGDQALEMSLEYFAKLFGCEELKINEAVFTSEMQTASRNRALGHLLKGFELLDNPVEEVLKLYFKHCSIEVNTESLSRFGATLARKGISENGERLISAVNLRRLMSVMLSCGMYNYAGQWIYEVGLPAKSGVSGGILTVAPENFGIAVYSPRINQDGCSERGAYLLKKLVHELKLHVYDYR